MKTKMIAFMLAISVFACGSNYTILDRSSLEVSPNSRLSAKNIIPGASQHPALVEQLAMAEEIYQKQLYLLKDRRNKLRSRKRYLDVLSFGSLAAATIGVGATALASSDADASKDVEQAGLIAMGGLAVGTIFQIAEYMQEGSSSIDSKIRHLELVYNTMIENLRLLMFQRNGKVEGTGLQNNEVAQMGAIIQSFITKALAINVKG